MTEVGNAEGASPVCRRSRVAAVWRRVQAVTFFDRGALVRAADDRGEDRWLRGLALQVAEDGASAEACRSRAEKHKLVCE